MAGLHYNPTVERMKAQLVAVSTMAHADLHNAVYDAAKLLAATMAARVPVRSGKLRESIRIERGKRGLTYIVRAGGPLTTNESGYDYSLATEFGTEKERARPFFWTTYRARKDALRRIIINKVRLGSMRGIR